MADQPQESIQHPQPDRRSPQTQQSKYLGEERRKQGGEPETTPGDRKREELRDEQTRS